MDGVRNALPLFQDGAFDGLKKYHGDRYKEVFMAWYSIWLAPSFKDWNITKLLPSITCPQLIIQGKNDQYGTLEQVDTIQKSTAGNSTVFISEKCHHAPHKEDEKGVLSAATEFILFLR